MPLPAFLARFLPRPQPQQLNRALLLVIPREPFIEWAARVTGYPLSEMRETLKRDRTAYLIPMSDDIKVEPEVVKAYWPTLFEHALYDWDADCTVRCPQSRLPQPCADFSTAAVRQRLLITGLFALPITISILSTPIPLLFRRQRASAILPHADSLASLGSQPRQGLPPQVVADHQSAHGRNEPRRLAGRLTRLA